MAGVRGSSRFRTAQIHSLSMPVFVFKNNIAKVDPNHQKRDLSVVLVGMARDALVKIPHLATSDEEAVRSQRLGRRVVFKRRSV